MKRKLNIFLLLISLITLFIPLSKVNALSLSFTYLETGSTSNSGITQGPGGKWNIGLTNHTQGWEPVAKFIMDGKVLYCIEPRVETNQGSEYSADLISKKLDANKRLMLEKINYVGYGYNADVSDEMYAATQIRIWQEVDSGITNIHTDIQTKIDLINNRLKYFEKLPSFNGKTILIDQNKYGEENAITLSDTNGLFQYYQLKSATGIHYSKNGNTLKIWREKNDSNGSALKFQLVPDNAIGTSLAYISPVGKQTLGYFKLQNTNQISINVSTTSTVVISKQDFSTGKELPGATLTIIEKDNNKIIDKWISTDTSHQIDGTKFIDGKEYILKEEIAPDGYNLSEEIVFTYKLSGTDKIIMKNKLTENPNTGIKSPYIIGVLIILSAYTLLYMTNKFSKIKNI